MKAKTTLPLLLLLGCGAPGERTADGPPPNVILFLVDDLGWQDTSVPFHTEPTPPL